jgi:hypothetical protein
MNRFVDSEIKDPTWDFSVEVSMPGRDVSSRGLQLAIHAALATFENLICTNQCIRHTT